jgi:hypothetical protein
MISFAFGFVSALVVIQFFPRVSYVGAWIVTKTQGLFAHN